MNGIRGLSWIYKVRILFLNHHYTDIRLNSTAFLHLNQFDCQALIQRSFSAHNVFFYEFVINDNVYAICNDSPQIFILDSITSKFKCPMFWNGSQRQSDRGRKANENQLINELYSPRIHHFDNELILLRWPVRIGFVPFCLVVVVIFLTECCPCLQIIFDCFYLLFSTAVYWLYFPLLSKIQFFRSSFLIDSCSAACEII